MKRSRTGLSLVEVMIGASLTALIMLAVFTALNGSFVAFRANQSESMVATRSRLVLMRMLDHIRATQNHLPRNTTPVSDFKADSSKWPVYDTGFTLGEPQSDGSLIIYNYWWDNTSTPSNPQLKMSRTVNGVTTTAVLLNQVSNFSIVMSPGKDSASAAILLHASIDLEVREQNTHLATGQRVTGSNAVPEVVALSGSASPRLNAWTGRCLDTTINLRVGN